MPWAPVATLLKGGISWARCSRLEPFKRLSATLKTHRDGVCNGLRYANPDEAIADITHDIVAFYNTHRLHATFGYRSPADYEKATT